MSLGPDRVWCWHGQKLQTRCTVDVATVPAAHFAALKAGDDERVDLNDLCSSLLTTEEPDWLQDGETVHQGMRTCRRFRGIRKAEKERGISFKLQLATGEKKATQ